MLTYVCCGCVVFRYVVVMFTVSLQWLSVMIVWCVQGMVQLKGERQDMEGVLGQHITARYWVATGNDSKVNKTAKISKVTLRLKTRTTFLDPLLK